MVTRYLVFMALILLLVVPVILLCIGLADKRIRKRESDELFVRRNRFALSNKLIQLYQFFGGFLLTRKYMFQISRRYELLCPSDPREIARKSMGLALINWGISFVLIAAMLLAKPTIYYAGITIFLIWIINSKGASNRVRNGNIRILKQLDMLLSDIRHFYYIKGSVEDAILESIELAGKEMKIHAAKIYEVLTSDHMEEAIIQYNDSIHNNYLKMFLAQCVAVINDGDKTVNDQSLFLRNIINLKADINTELRKINQIKFMFMGITIMIVMPVVFLDAMRAWASNMVLELYDFYYGRVGILIIFFIFALAIILFELIGYLEENQIFTVKNYKFYEAISNVKPVKLAIKNYTKKYYGKMERLKDDLKKMGESITPKQLLVKRMIYFLVTVMLGIVLLISLHSLNRYNLTYRVDNINNLTNTAYNQEDAVKTTITKYVSESGVNKGLGKEALKKKLSKTMKGDNTIENVANEIVKRLEKKQKEYLKWYEIFLIIVTGVIAYYLPYWMIRLRKDIMKLNMNNEVIQFQSIIIMLMYIDRMTIPKVLEFMEGFAVIFKDSIRTCLNEYDSGDMEALQHLKESEKFVPLQRLADNFIMSDKIGLERAFDEIAVERTNAIEQRKQENEINIYNKGTLAKFIGFSFFVMVIIFYLAAPIVIESLRQFNLFNIGLNSL